MNETTPGSEIIVISTSAEPTKPYEWNQFKGAPSRPTIRTGTAHAVEIADTVIATGDRPSAGTASTSLDFLGSTGQRLPSAPTALHSAAIENVSVVDRAYPHLLEAAQPAVSLMRHCLGDARLALDSFEDADFNAVAMRLGAIAAQCATAHPMTTFNESFGAVVSFIRRAAIAADVSQISRRSLNSMIHALNRLTNDPMINLGEGADMLGALSESGWFGDHVAVERLLASLLMEDIETESAPLLDASQTV